MSYFDIKPMTEDEIDKLGLMEKGVYDFEVIKSVRKESKNGNPMAEIQLKIWDKDGHVRIIYDYLVFTEQQLPIRKIRHFCYGVGLEKEYESSKVPEALNGYTGKVEIGIQEARPTQDGGMYPAKNVVIDYLKRDAATSTKNSKNSNDFVDNEIIPF